MLAMNAARGAESGLCEIREVGLVPFSPASDVCPAKHALTSKNKKT
jgi:hypothetical protein